MKRYLIFDITNVLYRTFYANKSDDDITLAGLASHSALTTLNKYFNQFKPHKVVMCFDRSNWRKEYTQTDECVSGKVYKGHRRKNLTPKEQAKFDLFVQHMNEFEDLVRNNTSVVVLANEGLEADDLVAGTVQTLSVQEPESEFIVVSTDKDLIQLLGFPNTRLINPADGKDRSLQDWGGDAEYFMFEKCIRGDLGDNVQSALPRCRSTRIEKAYNDPYERANLMMETWNDATGKTFRVKDLFEENRMLMDLQCQPREIQILNIKTVLEGLNNPGKFSLFHFMKYLGKYELKKIAEKVDNFVPMLSR